MCDYHQKKNIFFLFPLILFLILLSVPTILLSQNDEWYKNLKEKEAQAQSYSEKLFIQSELSIEMAEFDNQKAMSMAQKCLSESKKNNFLLSEAKALSAISEILRIRGRSFEALECSEKALEIFIQLKNIEEISNAKRDLGTANSNISKFTKAHELFKEALEILEKNKRTNSRTYALALNQFALNLLRQGEYKQALEQMENVEKLFEKIKDNKNQVRIKNNLGLIKKNMGFYYAANKDYLEALEKNEKINKIHRNTIIILINLGNLYLHKKDSVNYKNSFKYYQKAYQISLDIKDTIQITFALEALAKYHITLKKYDEAKNYYWKGFNLMKLTQNYIEEGYYLMRVADFYNITKEYSESIKITNQAIQLFEKKKNKEALSQGFAKMAVIQHYQKQYQSSQNTALKALELANQSDHKNIPYLYSIILNNYIALEQYQKAEEWGIKVVEYLKKVKSNSSLLETYRKLYVLDTTQKKYQRAIYWLNQYEFIKDSLITNKKDAEMLELQMKYNTKEQDNENIYLKKINQLKEEQLSHAQFSVRIIVAVLFLASITLVILISQRLKKRKILLLLNKKNEEITQKNKALEDLNEVKNRVFSLVSHDMRGPLGNLKAVLSLIEGGHLSPQEEKEIFQQLNVDVTRTYDFLQNLLVWAKSQMEGFTPVFVEVDVRKTVKKNFDILEAQANKKVIKLKNQIDKNIWSSTDEDILSVILINLISNAIKFTDSKGEIIISNEVKDNKIFIAIKDNGTGIAKENHSKIFGDVKFTTTGTNNEKGTGFGLSMCRDFVKALKGDIWFESEENKGTTFYFTLPISLVMMNKS
ncbi:MAG: GHKL domain-containing protein [Bacteroidetes bacterium]|nr:MAG: GHKL domain-containing protein [Bacteroidota bacterium]TAG89322.1 MAG: GHKL domain-containing protein [Bacteroidota bacterium]